VVAVVVGVDVGPGVGLVTAVVGGIIVGGIIVGGIIVGGIIVGGIIVGGIIVGGIVWTLLLALPSASAVLARGGSTRLGLLRSFTISRDRTMPSASSSL
jgi:hypothetical protein